MERTHYCGTLRRTHIGLQATVCGWVLTCRDMGGVIFVDVRDREGVVQTVFDQAVADPASFALAERLKNQSVVQITGEVRLRDESTYNPALPTGEVELAGFLAGGTDGVDFSVGCRVVVDDDPVPRFCQDNPVTDNQCTKWPAIALLAPATGEFNSAGKEHFVRNHCVAGKLALRFGTVRLPCAAMLRVNAVLGQHRRCGEPQPHFLPTSGQWFPVGGRSHCWHYSALRLRKKCR